MFTPISCLTSPDASRCLLMPPISPDASQCLLMPPNFSSCIPLSPYVIMSNFKPSSQLICVMHVLLLVADIHVSFIRKAVCGTCKGSACLPREATGQDSEGSRQFGWGKPFLFHSFSKIISTCFLLKNPQAVLIRQYQRIYWGGLYFSLVKVRMKGQSLASRFRN